MGHIGDSRVYMIGSKGWLMPLTTDHTVEWDARRRGMPCHAAILLPDVDKLTRVIGVKSLAEVEALMGRWDPGDMLLLCTDGVSNGLDSEVIASILLDAADVETAAQTLVNRAVEGDGGDNATAVVVRRTR